MVLLMALYLEEAFLRRAKNSPLPPGFVSKTLKHFYKMQGSGFYIEKFNSCSSFVACCRFVCNQEPAGRYNLQFSLVNCASCAFRNAAAIRARARFGSGQGNYYDSHGEHMM